MNVLIICPKSDLKNYLTVVKTAPDAKVLGAVNVVENDLIDNIGLKYNPHIIIYDTDVVAKKCSISTIINLISVKYPHIPFVVFTSEDDNNKYTTPYIIKNQISSIEFIDTIKKAYADYNNTYQMKYVEGSTETEELPVTPVIPTVNFKSENDKEIGITEKLSPYENINEVKVDKLSIKLIDNNRIKRKYKKYSFNYKILLIAILSVFIVIIISLLCLKLFYNNNLNNPTELNVGTSEATYDEATPDETSLTSEGVIIQEETESVPVITAPQTTLGLSETVANNIEQATQKQEKETAVSSSSATASTNEKKSQNNNSSSSNSSSNSVNKKNSSSSAGNSSNGSSSSTIISSSVISNANSGTGSSAPKTNNSEAEQPKNANDNVNVSSVSLNLSSYSMYVGDSFKLSASVWPSNATNKTVYWTSSDSSIASVSDGKVTAKNSGTVVITARAENKTASCTIQVNKKTQPTTAPTAHKYSITPEKRTISVGSNLTIKVSGDTNGCIWEISNPGVVEMVGTHSSREIIINAKKAGVTNITATLSDGTVLKSKITVV